METTEIKDPSFRKAVEAIDAGDLSALEDLLATDPGLITTRLADFGEGYFSNPYLLWFVAGNPIRKEKIPDNIIEITTLLIDTLKRQAPTSVQQQLDYTLELVATGWVVRKCGVQIKLMDLLIDAGAVPTGAERAVANSSADAAKHLIARGAPLSIITATGLNWVDDVQRLAPTATSAELLVALTAAAFTGNADITGYLLSLGVNPNGYPDQSSGFHSHGTPLHQAVSSASIATVQLLVEAGADLAAKDTHFDGTPLDWALYLAKDTETDEAAKTKFWLIADYLKEKEDGLL